MRKLKSYPKKPKQSASLKVMENYLQRVKEVDKYNAKIKSDKKKRESLKQKISKLK